MAKSTTDDLMESYRRDVKLSPIHKRKLIDLLTRDVNEKPQRVKAKKKGEGEGT